MFNEDLKSRFISETAENEAQTKGFKRLFGKTEPFENSWDTDISHANVDQMQQVVDQIMGFRSWGKNENIHMLEKYFDWCYHNGDNNVTDALKHVDKSGVEKMRNRTVRTPQHMKSYIDNVIDARDDTTRAPLKVYLWLAFSGVFEYDARYLRTTDIDLKTMTIKLRHCGAERTYPIYREAINAFRTCVNNSSFIYLHKCPECEYKRNRVQGDFLLRGLETKNNIDVKDSLTTTRFMNGLARCRRGLTDEVAAKYPNISYHAAWISGVFYRAFQAEMAGEDVDFRYVARESLLQDIQEKPYSKKDISAKISSTASHMKNDYNRWKKTFLG